MADAKDALIDVTHELMKETGASLDAKGRTAVREIFDLTVGAFAAKGEKQARPIKVWDNPKFKSFILGQVRRIAKAAKANAKGGKITGANLNAAAVEVMTKTQKFCRTAIAKGKLKVIIDGPGEEGEVCSSYLAAKTT
jgi:hypothetical protein